MSPFFSRRLAMVRMLKKLMSSLGFTSCHSSDNFRKNTFRQNKNGAKLRRQSERDPSLVSSWKLWIQRLGAKLPLRMSRTTGMVATTWSVSSPFSMPWTRSVSLAVPNGTSRFAPAYVAMNQTPWN